MVNPVGLSTPIFERMQHAFADLGESVAKYHTPEEQRAYLDGVSKSTDLFEQIHRLPYPDRALLEERMPTMIREFVGRVRPKTGDPSQYVPH